MVGRGRWLSGPRAQAEGSQARNRSLPARGVYRATFFPLGVSAYRVLPGPGGNNTLKTRLSRPMINCLPSPSNRRSILAGTIATLTSATIGLSPEEARAGNTWDGGSPLNGNWSTVQNWNGDTLPDFLTPITFAGNANLLSTNDSAATSVGGIIFDALADAFTLRGSPITLTGNIADNALAGQTINLAMTIDADRTIDVGGASLTIGPGGTSTGVISGAGGITKTGIGTLTLGAVNTYIGNTTLDGGSVVYTADNTVSALNFGFLPTASTVSTNTSTLDLTNANLTASGLIVQSNSATPNTINIGAGKTLQVNGPLTVGVSDAYSSNFPGVRTALTVTGGSLVVNGSGGNFSVGLPRTNAATGADPVGTVDLRGLANFTYTGGELRLGGGNVVGILQLASTTNTIIASQVRIGDSSIPPVTGVGDNNGNSGGTSTLALGPGTNVINADSIIIGATKSRGILNFQDPALGSLVIAGQSGGTSPANITVCNATVGTFNGNSSIDLNGHTATIQAGTVTIGQLSGSSAGPGNGSASFDTGTFTAAVIQLAVNTSGASSNGAIGTFTLGGTSPNLISTGVLNVTSQFFLANRTNIANQTSPANGTFVINGGTANINTDILDASTTGNPGSRNTTLTLAAGTLNMMGHAIGSSTSPITNVNITTFGLTATLANLGGTGINGAGLTINGGGTLLLDGTNTYTGTTTVGNGTVKLGTATAYPSASALVLGDALGNSGVFDLSGFNASVAGLSTVGAGTANVIGNSSTTSSSLITVNSGITTFAGTIQNTLESGNKNVALTMTGANLTLSGNSTYTGATTLTAGTLILSGTLNGTSVVTVQGSLGGGGTITTSANGNVSLFAGSSLAPGNGAGTLTLALGTGSLDLSATAGLAGYLQFELGPTVDRVLLSSGKVNIGAGGLDLDDFTFTNVGGLAQGTYVLFDTNSDILGTLGSHLQTNLFGFDMKLQFANGTNGRDDLVLVVIPEPTSLMALLVGLGALALRRRKTNV
jgi:autotransporter-associated beta strand protein